VKLVPQICPSVDILYKDVITLLLLEHVTNISIVKCRGLRVAYKKVLDWLIRFTDTLYRQLELQAIQRYR
jgi:hypothetical protein